MAYYGMEILYNSQPKFLGTKNVACRKRKISTVDYVIDVKELEKDNKIIRAAMLKKRYAKVIFKSQQQVLGELFDEKEMKKKSESWEKQLREEKAKLQRKRDREAARIAIASIKRTVNFDDGLQAERELLAIMGATSRW